MESQADFNTDWRIVAATIYKKPIDSKIFGTIELDVTDLEAYIHAKRSQGLKITNTHIFTLAIARGLKEAVPELNCYVKRGNIVHRNHVNAMVSVLMDGGKQMGSVMVENADQLTLSELADFLRTEYAKSRKGEENPTMQKKNMLASIPWPIRGWIFSLIQKVTMEWGFNLPSVGISSDSFGSFILGNIGSVGIDIGYPALFPSANMAMVVSLGGLSTKPAVVNGEILPRRILIVNAAIDHRVADAVHAGRMFTFLKQLVKHPELLEQRPAWMQESVPASASDKSI